MASLLFAVVLLGYFIYKIVSYHLAAYLLEGDVLYARGVVIDERNYHGNSPVSQTYSLSYVFIVDGKEYKNNSHDPALQVGDSVDVKYVRSWPGFSKRVR